MHVTLVIGERLIVLETSLICGTATAYLREQLLLQCLGGSKPWPLPGATTGRAKLPCALPSPPCWPSCTQLGVHYHSTCGLALVFHLDERWWNFIQLSCWVQGSQQVFSELCSLLSAAVFIWRAACGEPWSQLWLNPAFLFLCVYLEAILAFLAASGCSSSLYLIQSTAPTSHILVISKRCLFLWKNSSEMTVCSLHSWPGWERSKYPISPWNSYCMKIK